MLTLAIALGSFFLYLAAYHTYGRYLARRIFRLDPEASVPSASLEDGADYVPTAREVVFGHHFTSIAGTGPIVGPALAVIWGWVPALLWVLFGSILIGAVHDFGALVVSMRNRGQTVGDIAGRVLSRRARLLFLAVLFLALSIVLAIFGLVIANVWDLYPSSIFPCLVQIPIAIVIGVFLHRRGVHLFLPSLLALGIMYLAIIFGDAGFLGAFNEALGGQPGILGDGIPIIAWVMILLLYSYFASVLPVWTLLQPRDFINSLQLISALVLIVAGLAVAALAGAPSPDGGRVALEIVAPRFRPAPEGAPWIFPFLFITIACGAVSGFHCLVSSGTSSKQIKCESDAQLVGFGAMLTEGFLAILVILACVAGLGLGARGLDGELLTGAAAYDARYASWTAAQGLGAKLGAFVEGAANFLKALGLGPRFTVALMGVFVASFAATTLDTACRLQRYVVQELASTFAPRVSASALAAEAYDFDDARPGVNRHTGRAAGRRPHNRNPLVWLTNKHGATIFAVTVAGVLAAVPAPGKGLGSGGLILWPLFGATNQLLAGLAFLVVAFWLWRRTLPVWFIVPPAVFMLVLPGIAMSLNIASHARHGDWHLVLIGAATVALEAWIIIEALNAWPRARGVLEPADSRSLSLPEGGRSC